MDPNISKAVQEFKKTIEHLRSEYSRLQIGRANPSLVEEVQVEAYGTKQALKSLAAISVPEATTLQIQPWDRGALGAIETAIKNSNLNLNPINNGTVILLKMPPLTEERRKDLVKLVHQHAEHARIAIRNSRGTAHTAFKQMEQNKEMTEDDRRHAEKQLQDEVDKANKEIEESAKKKEEDIMKV
ncbi:ribosome recycling factor [Candidatus Peregrinibacteria bacterium CG11_big_fil_rev_8_21_14_0_20_46_8]|nr:MAG: ribosome recycling factor [Candidatus Peregrinibacteria bacterium CG11_big_fil_rev_8_21_14_0_20_46_8]